MNKLVILILWGVFVGTAIGIFAVERHSATRGGMAAPTVLEKQPFEFGSSDFGSCGFVKHGMKAQIICQYILYHVLSHGSDLRTLSFHQTASPKIFCCSRFARAK